MHYLTIDSLEIAKKYYQLGELAQARIICEKLLQDFPDQSEILHVLGITLAGLQNYEKAIELVHRAISLDASEPVFYNSLGNLFLLQRQFEKAFQCYRQALRLNPNFVDAYHNLGIVLSETGHFTEAILSFQKALAIHPQNVQTRYHLGMAYTKQYQLIEAISCYQQILSTYSLHQETYRNLGKVLKDIGQVDESLLYYQKALELDLTHREIFQNFLYTLNFSINYNRSALFLEHQRFNQQYALPLASYIQPHLHKCQRSRRLRIAYISPDFRKHSLTYFVEPLLHYHDHNQFEIYCYFNHDKRDQVTQRLQKYADHWVDCASFSDETLVNQIRQDQIDILVDLTGHTSRNRILVFSQKPAPIQVFHTIGYSNTTGLTAMDYRITDTYVDPEGTESFSSETLIRMPVSYYCYQPHEGSPPINSLPALEEPYITFASFHSPAKLNKFILSLWAQLLCTLPHARLFIMSKVFVDASVRQWFQEKLCQSGISTQQVTISYAPSTEETLRSYHQVDLGLDAYPFNGATTTCQALWMGVPVITLVGNTPASRAGLSILSAVGLTEFITYTPEEYLEKCYRLAHDLSYLQRLRQTLRTQMQSSSLMDALTSTRFLESAYLRIWKVWCASHQPY